jgi:hypothetical protein
LFGFAVNANAQVTATAGTEAHIITPLDIDWVADMDFGNVGVINQIGTIVLTTAAGRTGTGGATPAVPSGTVTAAEFDMTGAPAQQIFITINGGPVAAASVTVLHTNLLDNMLVDTFVTDPPTGFVLDAGGAQTILVGATLHTGVSQLAGTYHTASNWALTINYQ